MAKTLFIGSDNLFTETVTDQQTGNPVVGATVLGALENEDGTLITTFAYTDNEDGTYSGVLTAAITTNLASCTKYLLKVSVSADSTNVVYQDPNCMAVYQGAL